MAPICHVVGSLCALALLIISPSLLVAALPASAAPADSDAQQYANETTFAHDNAGPRPFYAIAHRVLSYYCVGEALQDGANALEIDMRPYKGDQWYADHDGIKYVSNGDSAKTMFETVAAERRAGKKVLFVWLDIKEPDGCGASDSSCNIETLRTLARTILEPAGVRVLYGFYNDKGRAYKVIRDGLNDNEAINLDGNADDVERSFETGGPADIRKRVMSKGLFFPKLNFGDCRGYGHGICPQLREAADSKKFGQVFGWTITESQKTQAQRLMGEAGVDGLISGYMASEYRSSPETRASLGFITSWLEENADKRYLATLNDMPW